MNFDRRKKLLLFCCVIFTLTVIAAPVFAQFSSPGGGVDDSNGEFQLEGNTSTDTGICFGIVSTGPVIATPGSGNSCSVGTFVAFGSQTEDWDKIYGSTLSPPTATTLATATSFINDKFNTTADDQFTGGATKDINDFSQWLWNNSKPQAKDDFEHAYAAAYTRSSDGHIIVIAGADRYDNSGSSTAGFWFVQDPNVGSGVPTARTCAVPSGCAFGGTHKDGDTLIISQFTTGGTVSTIQVFTWESGSIGSALESGTQCNPLTGSAALCGTVNGVPVLTGGWSFSSKSSDATSCSSTGTGPGTQAANCVSPGEFLEVGLDLTQLFLNLNKPFPCISRFFAESRSSGTGISSTLSDLVGPINFPLCSISDTKTCTGAHVLSDGVTVEWGFAGQVAAKGGTMTSLSITDTPNNGSGFTNLVVNGPCSQAPTATSGCSPGTSVTTVAPGNPAFYNGSFDTTFVSNTLPNTATASALDPSGATLTANASWLSGNPPTLSCSPPETKGLTLTKSCFVTGIDSSLHIHVHFTGSVTNTGNVSVSGISVTDTPAGGVASTVLSGVTLAPGAGANFSGDYQAETCTPITDATGNEVLGRCAFNDTVNASGSGALGAGTITAMPNQATCNLCPGGTDSASNPFCAGS
jgi:hypothetical protein